MSLNHDKDSVVSPGRPGSKFSQILHWERMSMVSQPGEKLIGYL